jgi:hypothetical protein
VGTVRGQSRLRLGLARRSFLCTCRQRRKRQE